MAANGQPGAQGEPGPGHVPRVGDPPPQPGLAQERTALAWTRTAISFAAVGGVVLKRDLIPGLILLALSPAIWQLGRLAYRDQGKLILLTATVVGVAAIALAVSFT